MKQASRKARKGRKAKGKRGRLQILKGGLRDQYFFIESHISMSYGVSNETPWNSDAFDTKNAKILPKISISLDPPINSDYENVDSDSASNGNQREFLRRTAELISSVAIAPLPC